MQKTFHRGEILHFPTRTDSPEQNYQYLNDGILVIEQGKIIDLLDADVFFRHHPIAPEQVETHSGLLIPGMIDSHVHYPQMEMIASYGRQLLEWLNDYTFPVETKYADSSYAALQADAFIKQLFAHGTTTASVFATVHPQSVDAFFNAAATYQARMICGKVLMDRHSPDNLRDTADSGYRESKDLLERWHHQGRALYAITPRFAPTSTPEQLALAGQLAQEHPDAFIQTHLSENTDEIDWVKSLFPDAKDYLDVYERYGLVRDRALFGHGIHLEPREYQALASSHSSVIFCPTSNLFIGSGLFPYFSVKEHGIPVAIASDVGGGTSLNLLVNQAEAYKILQLQHQNLNPFESLYLCTQGAAVAMQLEHQIGNLNPGTEADFIELDINGTPMLKQRMAQAKTLEEKLFALIMLADERVIRQTYVNGQRVYSRR
ncbi:guanine deaminase [Vibrio rhizosphaerae]|uniref:Guanine deaminase n=1 Tax=Vibrio rhizosphaerae TaxID=398736 RepID=A0ABU4IXI5_9VIBR|nr:guanine deaminase [Vibrio rhizosphaerae]MDW6094111.1 guanine deaminase [Vibrio rhizosphaerae]